MAELSTDIKLTCPGDEKRRGGVRALWVQHKNNVTSFTEGRTDHDFNAVTMDTTADTWFKIEGVVFKGSYAGEGSNENGSSIINKTLTYEMPKLEKVKAAKLKNIMDSCDMVVIEEDYNGLAFVHGYSTDLGVVGMRASITETKEEGLDGNNAYTLTFTGQTNEPTREYTGTFETNSDGTKSFA